MSNKTGAQAHSQDKTARMIEGFIGLWDQGYSIPDIANAFDLDRSVVYRQLGKIAERAGLPREHFLGRKSPNQAEHGEAQTGTAVGVTAHEKPPVGSEQAELPLLDADRSDELFSEAIQCVNGIRAEVQATISTCRILLFTGGGKNEQ